MVSEEMLTAPVLGWGLSFVQGMRANRNLVIHYIFFSADYANACSSYHIPRSS